ncbi:PorP/SprF family type IX secretion system membrane protein [Luteibaculum oceani]|uniref:Type IX secretion system membrane protein PorP/SprF n=1 Tax=Luteibaculum oceani TaxID=1294296 RepID=A0A5C6V1Q1_9FLAO|nr:type IX secretion system membrane protein PorP/SprF [Luteibaculum oceani]TXC78326.1 type IX secretion system membrane protein PorP/SprF [Luteibaculum oceani]
MSKYLIRILILTFLGGLWFQEVKAQDPEFTQFYANPLYLNPAFAGSAKCPRIIANYRNQWPSIPGTFVTQTVSYDQFIPAIYGGAGIQLMRDNAGNGTLTTYRASLQYAYTFNLSREFAMKAGIEASFFQLGLDWSKLTFGDMIDPRKGFIYETQDTKRGGQVSNADFSAGILGFSENFFAGIAVHHLTEPNESLILSKSPLPRKYTVHAGGKFRIGDSYNKANASFISPNIMYQLQGDFKQLLYGMYLTKGPIVGGVWIRSKDSFILLAGVQTDVIRFGYSYDVTVSSLTTQSGGSHELSLGIQLDCAPQKRRFRTISCPSF